MFSDDSFDPSSKNSALLPSEQQMLNQARQLMDDNKPAQAAPLFAKLAEVLTSSKQTRRAASLHAQAALAFAKSRNDSALAQARMALQLMLQYKVDQQASAFYNELIHELNKRGMKPAAEALTKEFGDKVPQAVPMESHAAQLARLPSNCPNCGAPLRSVDVRWVAAGTAECTFCNTPIRV